MIFAEKLKTLRKEKNISQEQLAEKIHVSRQAITKWVHAVSKLKFAEGQNYYLKNAGRFTCFVDANGKLLAFCNFWKLKPLYIYLPTAICFLKKDILVTFWNRYKKTKPAAK